MPPAKRGPGRLKNGATSGATCVAGSRKKDKMEVGDGCLAPAHDLVVVEWRTCRLRFFSRCLFARRFGFVSRVWWIRPFVSHACNLRVKFVVFFLESM